MKKRFRKTFTVVLSVALCFMLAIGVVEIIGLAGNPAVVVEALGSGVDPAPAPTPSKPEKKSNPVSVKGKTVSIKGDTIKKKNVTFAKKKILTVKSAKGTVRYKLVSANKSKKKFSINKKTGKLTVKKGLKAGTYKLKIRVTAYGNSDYKQGSDNATVKVKVSKATVKPTPAPTPVPSDGTDTGSDGLTPAA